jgi:hypothetical protein
MKATGWRWRSLKASPRKKLENEGKSALMRRKNVLKVRLSDAELSPLDELAGAWRIRTRAGMLRALLRGAGSPEQPLAPSDSLDMLLAEVPELDTSEPGIGLRGQP